MISVVSTRAINRSKDTVEMASVSVPFPKYKYGSSTRSFLLQLQGFMEQNKVKEEDMMTLLPSCFDEKTNDWWFTLPESSRKNVKTFTEAFQTRFDRYKNNQASYSLLKN